MGDVNFTTHMLTAFLEKYGNLLQEYFINDALVGKYMSAGDLYNFIYPEAKEENDYERKAKIANEKEPESAEEENSLSEASEDNIDEERVSPKQSLFNRDCKSVLNFVDSLVGEKMPNKLSLVGSFFAGNFPEVNPPKNSENAYWENLFMTTL